ncbi:hypothetical protein GCM10027398_02490 [Azotobacter salinestris]
MGNRVEVVGEIRIHHFAGAALGDAEMDAPQRHLGVHAFAEAILPGKQVWVEDRPQYQQHGHLDNPVTDDRDAQRALPAVGLGNPYTQQGRAPILSGTQLLSQSLQPVGQSLVFDVLERRAVHPGRTAVGAAPPIGFQQDVYPVQLVPQAVEPRGRFALGFRP